MTTLLLGVALVAPLYLLIGVATYIRRSQEY
jgi:hypothetical protein